MQNVQMKSHRGSISLVNRTVIPISKTTLNITNKTWPIVSLEYNFRIVTSTSYYALISPEIMNNKYNRVRENRLGNKTRKIMMHNKLIMI